MKRSKKGGDGVRTVLEARVLENGICQIGMEAESLIEVVEAVTAIAAAVYQAIGEKAGEVEQTAVRLILMDIFRNEDSPMWKNGAKRLEMERDGNLMVNVDVAEGLLREAKERKEAEKDAAGEPDA